MPSTIARDAAPMARRARASVTMWAGSGRRIIVALLLGVSVVEFASTIVAKVRLQVVQVIPSQGLTSPFKPNPVFAGGAEDDPPRLYEGG